MCALIRGMTDILTPANLANSNSWSGGRANPITRSFTANGSLPLDTYNNNSLSVFSFTYPMSVTVSNSNYNDLSNQINVKATVKAASQNSALNLSRVVPNHQIITIVVNGIDNLGRDNSQLVTWSNVTRTVYYSSGATKADGNHPNICICEYPNSGMVQMEVKPSGSYPINQDYNVDYTLHSFQVYEGAFVNPPFKKAIVNTKGTSMLANIGSNVNQFYKIINVINDGNTLGWKRIIKIPLLGNNGNHVLKFYMGKGFNVHAPSYYEITATYTQGGRFSTNSFIKAEYYGVGNNSLLEKFRFAQDPNNPNDFYIEGYRHATDPGTNGETWRIILYYITMPISTENGYLQNVNTDMTVSSVNGSSDTGYGPEFGYIDYTGTFHAPA